MPCIYTLDCSVPAGAVFTDTTYTITTGSGSAQNKITLTDSDGASQTITVNNVANATTAAKLGTDAGDSDTPVYFSGGVPTACDSATLTATSPLTVTASGSNVNISADLSDYALKTSAIGSITDAGASNGLKLYNVFGTSMGTVSLSYVTKLADAAATTLQVYASTTTGDNTATSVSYTYMNTTTDHYFNIYRSTRAGTYMRIHYFEVTPSSTYSASDGRWYRITFPSGTYVKSASITPIRNTLAGYGVSIVTYYTGSNNYLYVGIDENSCTGFTGTVITTYGNW